MSLSGASCPGVASYPASSRGRRIDGERAGRVVAGRADDDRARPRDGSLDFGAQKLALIVAALEVVHFTGVAGGNPVFEVVAASLLFERGDAGQVEAFGFCEAGEFVGSQVEGGHRYFYGNDCRKGERSEPLRYKRLIVQK